MSNVDLSKLKISETAAMPRRPLGPRLLVAGVLLLAVAVAATFLWPLLLPPRTVRTAAIAVADVDDAKHAGAGTATAEAVGWVEADPFPTIVRPLVSGHIETLQVLEGHEVEAGKTVIATLASAALQAAHDRALAVVEVRRAAAARTAAEHRLASERLAQNAAALLRLRDAEVRRAGIETRLAAAGERTREAKAAAQGAQAALRAQQLLAESGNSYPVALERARADADAAAAALAAAQAQADGLHRELAAQRDAVQLCRELAGDPVDLRGAAAVAEAAHQQALCAVREAETEAMIAARELGWATVVAPIDGVVLRLEAEPGDMVGHGQDGVVALYDPTRLRARIDVPLDSIDGVREGQRVEITSEAIGDTVVAGVVQRLQHETDLLKNTLQVKIGLIEPPPLLRPETLCRARFLADDTQQALDSKMVTAFRVPAAAVQDGRVFVFDPRTGTARGIPVEVVSADGDRRLVRGELSPTQRVIIEPVDDGENIQESER